MVVSLIMLLAAFEAIVGLLDGYEIPKDVDRRNNLELWIIGVIAVIVIFSAGFVIRSYWWPALTATPLFLFSGMTSGSYESSMAEAFFGWIPRFLLIAGIVTAVSGTGGALIGRWADAKASRRTESERWRVRVTVGFLVLGAAMIILGGVARGLENNSDAPVDRQEAFGQWIYGVTSNENMLVLGTGNGIVALDPTTQVTLWRVDIGGPVMSAPTVTEDRIYFGSNSQYAYAFDLNGTELWRHSMGNFVFDSPVVANGMVYVGSAAKFVALDAATGKEVWIIDLGTWVEISWSEVVDGMIYLGTAHGELLAVDAISGVEEWRYVVPTVAKALNATPGAGALSPWIRNAPVVADGVVYFGCGDGHIYAVDAKTGEKLWNLDTARAGQPNVAVTDSVVYAVTHGNVYALGARDGTILWNVKVDGGIWYPPVVTDDLLIVAFDRSRGRLTGLDLDTGETRWIYVYSEDPDLLSEFTYMHLRGTILFAGSSGQGLFALDADSGALLWRMTNP
jgi:outer membrane protein assembly factor BamB